MPERASPFGERLAAGAGGGTAPPGVTLAWLNPAAFVELLELPGVPSAQLSDTLAALAPGAASLALGATVDHAGYTVGRIAPRRLVVIGATPLLAGLEGGFVIVDDSHARAGVRVAGAAADVLGKGLSLDLSERGFAVGGIAAVRGFGLALTLVRRAGDTFDVYCARSFAASLLDGLADAALEAGWRSGTVLN
ncbi:MAG: hypothetical protein R3D27_08410 [Hyphomicrobiaceae bacterium]